MLIKKLVRDRIPEMIKNQNKKFDMEIIKDDKIFFNLLKDKLLEETNEFINSINIENQKEELADILEVIDAICDFKKINKEELTNIKNKKLKERGGFVKRILLSYYRN